jgi:hypothetical protein
LEAKTWREETKSNPWICWDSCTGYHRFSSDDDNAECTYEGCERTRRDLKNDEV